MNQRILEYVENAIRNHYRTQKVNRRDKLNKMALAIPKKLEIVGELLSKPGDKISEFDSLIIDYELAELVYYYIVTNHIYGLNSGERKHSAKTRKLKRLIAAKSVDDVPLHLNRIIEGSLDVLKEDVKKARTR